jgi:hypothetical protein
MGTISILANRLVAIATKHSQPWRKLMLYLNSQKVRSATGFGALGASATVDMVESEKLNSRFATAFAFSTVRKYAFFASFTLGSLIVNAPLLAFFECALLDRRFGHDVPHSPANLCS